MWEGPQCPDSRGAKAAPTFISRRRTGRIKNSAAYAIARGFDVFERDHAIASLAQDSAFAEATAWQAGQMDYQLRVESFAYFGRQLL